MKLTNFFKFVTVFFVVCISFLIFTTNVSASCSNQIQCEGPVCCDWQGSGCTQPACTQQDPIQCSGDNQSACENEQAQCPNNWVHVGGTCNWGGGGGSCPPGQIFCGGCIGACRPNTQTCNEWIADECTPPPPPPGQETCYQCSGNSCQGYQVPVGTCSTSCGSGCGSPPPGNPSCNVTLNSGNYTLAMAGPTVGVTATVSNVQNGTVSSVGFSSSNTSVATVSPTSDTSSPYQSTISQVSGGSATLTANVYMGNGTVRCSATAAITVAPDIAPDCETFVVSNPTVTQGTIAQYSALVTDEAANLLTDGGFDSGSMANWPVNYQLNEWWAVPIASFPSPGAEGTHYAKISRQNPAPPPVFDPFSGSALIDTGENVMGQTYTLKFLGRSHEYSATNPNGHVRIPGLLLQTDTLVNTWAPWPEFVNTQWNEYSYNLTFPTGSTTNKFRVLLRPPENYPNPWNSTSGYNNWPVYYDSVRIFKTNDSGVNNNTVNFYYIPTASNPCVAGNWTLIGLGTPDPSNPEFYTVNWNTTGITAGTYRIAVNAADNFGNFMSGNPGNCNVPGVTYRPLCNGTQTVSACTVSCTEDCGGPGTLAGVPSQVTGTTVTGIDGSGRKNLTTSSNVTITWNQATITSPATIEGYDIWIYPQGSAAPAQNATTCTGCQQLTTSGVTSTSTTYTPQYQQTDEVAIYVRAKNTNPCGNIYGPWSAVRNVDYVGDVGGVMYDLTTPPVGNNCIGTGTPIDITAGAPTVSLSGTTGTAVPPLPGSTYSFTNVPYAPTSSWADYGFDIDLTLANPDPTNAFYCNCPGGTPTACSQTDTPSPASVTSGNPQNFFVTSLDLSNGPWWRTSEGNVYAALAYTSNVPDSANSYLISQNLNLDPKSAGIPLGGSTITANGYYTEYNLGGTLPVLQPRAENTSHTNMARENYAYFTRNIDLNAVTSLPVLPTVVNQLPNPNSGTLYDDARVFKATGTYELSVNALQTVASGTKMIIFVDGDVHLRNAAAANRHLITVEQGGYLAIIATGDIIIYPGVGNDCSYPTCTTTDTNIDGVFVADGQIIVDDDANNATADRMFVGEGTFVGWGGVDLRRTFDNTANALDTALNNTYATEVFHFRPDFVQNTPEVLRRPNIVWQEVN